MSKRTDRANYCMYLSLDEPKNTRYEYVRQDYHTLQFDFGNMIEGTNKKPKITTINEMSQLSATSFIVIPVFAYKESRTAMVMRDMNFEHPNNYSKLIGNYKVLGFLYVYFDHSKEICKLEYIKNRIETDKEKIREILTERKKTLDKKTHQAYAAESRRKIRKLKESL